MVIYPCGIATMTKSCFFFTESQKHWCLHGANVEINSLISGVIIEGGFRPLPICDFKKDRIEFNDNDFELIISITNTEWGEIKASLRNLSGNDVIINAVVLGAASAEQADQCIQLGHAPSDSYRILLNSFDSWGKTGSRPWKKQIGSKLNGDRLHDRSYLVTAIWSRANRQTLIIGSTRTHEFLSVFNWTASDSDKTGFSFARELNISISSGEQLQVGDFAVFECQNLCSGLELYASRYFKPVETEKHFFYGWSTWDYYLSWPTIADIESTCDFINSDDDLKSKVKIISIDDGWYHQRGDWRANIDFCSNRATCADLIISKGFVPGIWTLPLLVSPGGRLSVKNLDWFIKGRDGLHLNMNMGDPLFTDAIYCLDFTVPQVQEYILDLYKSMYDEGFRYFKIDFLRTCCQLPQYSLANPKVSRLSMLRDCIKMIRQAVGKDSAICACGAPFEAVQGLVDFVRTCDDVKHYWSNLQRSARSIAHRFWTHGNLWYADPDFCIVRGKDTAGMSPDCFPLAIPKDHIPFRWISGSPMSINEAQVWATIQIIAGGPIILGDNLLTLNASGRKVLDEVLRTHDAMTKFAPLDLMDSPAPAVWIRYKNSIKFEPKQADLIAIFNWWDNVSEYDISSCINGLKYVDIWTNEKINLADGMIRIAPRSVRLLKIY